MGPHRNGGSRRPKQRPHFLIRTGADGKVDQVFKLDRYGRLECEQTNNLKKSFENFHPTPNIVRAMLSDPTIPIEDQNEEEPDVPIIRRCCEDQFPIIDALVRQCSVKELQIHEEIHFEMDNMLFI